MTTAADLIASCKEYLYAGAHDPVNTLNGSHNTSVTTFTFNYELGAIREGAYLSVDLEIVYVVSASGSTATVIRAQRGTTAATHASGAVVTVNPKFSDFGILRELNNELADLSSPSNGLFKATPVTLTYNAAVQGYDLTSAAAVLDILTVHAETVGPAKAWPEITKYRLKRNFETGDFASTFAIVLYESGQAGRDIRVTYSGPFTALAAVGDDVQSVAGLPATANDIPPLGAALRLLAVREAQRNFNESQPTTRRAEEVPPGAQFNSARGLIMLRQERIRDEASRLVKAYPQRRRLS